MDMDWRVRAACRNADRDIFFLGAGEQSAAKRICRRCPVVWECLAEALEHDVQIGVWGGMSERERRQLLRQYPEVSSWRAWLRAAQAHVAPSARR